MINSAISEETPVYIQTSEDIYNVVIDNDRVTVSVSDVIIKAEEDEVYDIEIDTSVSGVTYVGQALPGTASSIASWRIKKITETAGGSSVDWANGSANFVHVWDDRLAFTYGP